MTTFKDSLRQLRTEKKMSQQDIAHLLGINRTTYTKYETGKSEPDVATICHLALLFDVSTDQLLNPRAHNLKEPRAEVSTANEHTAPYQTNKNVCEPHSTALRMKAVLMNMIELAFDCTPENETMVDQISQVIDETAQLTKAELRDRFSKKNTR